MTRATDIVAQCVRVCFVAGLVASWTMGAAAQEASKDFIMHSAAKSVTEIQFEDYKG